MMASLERSSVTVQRISASACVMSDVGEYTFRGLTEHSHPSIFAVLRRSLPYDSQTARFSWGHAGHSAIPTKIRSPVESHGLAPIRRDRAEPKTCPRAPVADEVPVISGMAGRYATALFELALEQGALDRVGADLDTFDRLIVESPDLARFVRSPVFAADEQIKALSAVLDRAGISGLAAKFLKVIVSNRRLFAVGDIIRAYRAIVAKHKGEIVAEVTIAEQISDAHLSAIKEALNSVTGKQVKVDMRVDPAIIGGLVVKLGSRMVDSSLRTKLNAIKHAMKEVG
jgi:F-type H+-transporting ATPase subunit delta